MSIRTPVMFLMVLCLSAPASGQNPTVVAKILSTDSTFTQYWPLRGATVTILADGHRFAVKPLIADGAGYVSFDVALSTPFSLVFRGANRVPRMTHLAGESGSRNRLHVVLFTIEQYNQRYGIEEAVYKLEAERRAVMAEIDRVRSAISDLDPDTARQLDELKKSISEAFPAPR